MAKDLDLSEFGGTPELDLSEFDQPPPKPTGTLRKIGDVGIALGQGVVGGVKSITDATGASNRVSSALDSANKSLSGFLSPQRASEIAARQQTIKDAEASGSTLNEIGANLGALAEAPASTIAQGLGSIVPTVAAAYLTRGRSLATQGAATLGIGAAQGAGAVKGSIYDAVSEQHQAAGMAPEQAKAQADAAQAYTGPNAGNIAIGGAAGAAAGRFGAESIIAKMGQPARLGFIKRTGVTAAQEGATEALQGGQERLAANMALQGEGFDVPTMQGVAGQAGLEGVVGGIIGGGIGAVSGGPQPPAIGADSPDAGAVNPPGAAPGSIVSEQGGGFAPSQEPPKPPPAPPAAPPSKAQAMGIDPAAGPLQSAAGVTVDTGADVVTQQQAVEKQKAEAAAKEKAKPGADGKKPEPEAPPPVQPVTPDPTAPVTGPFTKAIHGASNATPTPAPAVNPQGPAATQGAGAAVDSAAAPGVGADQGPQGPGAVPDAVPEPATAVTPVATPPTQESTNATQQAIPGESIDPETGEITQSGPQGAGSDGGQRPADALQPGADAEGPQPAPDQPAAPAAASAAPEGGTPAPVEPVKVSREVEAKADEVMRVLGDVGGTAITRDQVVTLINERGMAAADKTIQGLRDTIKSNQEAAAVAERAKKPPAPTAPVDMGAHTAATSPHNDLPEPTKAQKEAGNYKKAHLVISGVGISVENPEGSTRSGTDKDGKAWSNTMQWHYGYAKRTVGSDDEQQDVFVKPGTPLDYAGPVFVVDQIDPKTGKHDEYKSMLGAKSPMEARKAYMDHYAKDWKGLKNVTALTWDQWREWLQSPKGTAPAQSETLNPADQPPSESPASAAPQTQPPADSQPASQPAGPSAQTEGTAATGPSPDGTPDAPAKPPSKPTGGKNLRAAAYEKNPLLTFLAQHGLFHDKDKPGSQKAEFSPDKQVMVMGYGPVFRKAGMKPDLLVARAIEDGYLPQDGSELQLVDLIRRAIGGERIAPMFTEGAAETEMQKRMQAVDDLRELDDNEVSDLDPDIFAESNVSTEDAMRALGFTEQEIHDATAQGPRAPQEGRQGRGEPDETQAASPGEGAQGGPQAPPAEAEPEGLIAPTRADVLRQQAQAEAEAARKEQGGDKSIERKVTGDTPDMFNTQGSVFDQPAEAEPPAADPATQATTILDAANVTGKDRLDILKDVKSGALTPDEVQAAFPGVEKPAEAQYVIAEKRRIRGAPDENGNPRFEMVPDERLGRFDTVKQAKAAFMRKMDPSLAGTDDDWAAMHFDRMERNSGDYKVVKASATSGDAAPTETAPPATAAHKVGDLVKLTKPGVNGRVNIAGTITKILPDGRLEIRTQQDGYMTVAPSELGHKPTAAPTTTATTRSRPRDTITFKTPIKGPSGSSLLSYTWQWMPMDVVDARGEDRTVRVSDWDKADVNTETGREIVHQFVVAAPDGSTQTVSAETAVKLLGFAGNEAAPFKSAASAAKTLAKLRMQAYELGALLDQFTKDHDAVKAMKAPAPTSERNAEGWFEMGDAKVRQLEPGAMLPERLRTLTGAWRDNRLKERGWKSGESTKDLLGSQVADIEQRIKRAEKRLEDLSKEAPPAESAATTPAWHTVIPERGTKVAPADEKNYSLIPHRVATEAVEAVTQTQSMGNMALYAYVLPSSEGHHGAARLFPDDQTPPAPWALLFPEAVRMGMLTKEQAAEKLVGALRRAPILGTMAPLATSENDRNAFTLERLNRETNTMEPVTFARGEYVRFQVGGKDQFGDIDGISHAKREFSVDGLWHPFGFAYKAERPTPPAAKTVPLSSVIDSVNKKNGAGLSDADAVPATMDAIEGETALWSRITDGKATPEEFKAGFERWVAGKDAIVELLSKRKKDELLAMMGSMSAYRHKSSNKAEIVDAVWRDGMSNYSLGRSYSYGMGKNAHIDAVRNLVQSTDADQLAQFAADRKAAQEAAVTRVAQAKEAVKDPKTLDDFKIWMRATMSGGKTFKEARMMLTPEQRASFDDLVASETRGARKQSEDVDRTKVRVAGQVVDGDIIATKHTRKGHDLFVVKLAERVSREDYETLNQGAKRIGGYYSSFRGGGAIAGFQFTDRAQAEAFVKLAQGDSADAIAAAQERRDAFADDRSQTAAERLNEMADRIDDAASESLAVERKANTARRVRFAAAAESAARESQAMAKTMRNIAAAITEGRAKFLDRVRTKTQIELLQSIVASAHGNQLRAKYPAYLEQEKRKGQPPDAETADFAEFPSFTAFRSDLASLGRQLLEVDGTKLLGQRIMKVADDVSDAYLKFAKENFHRVATFSKTGGGIAAFSTRDAAQEAIQRSGYKGKAIAYQVKRGEHAVIMSPSEAINRGLWDGDGDKRITLIEEFGAELVEKIGRAARRGARVSVPWQFESAYDRLKKLSRMGIETPAEFRAALREFVNLREHAIEADRIKMLERAMVGKVKDGLDFFPTPASVADEMIAAADIKPEMAVLEPSAGMGHIADRIRAAGAEPDVIELAGDRRELLQEKGYHLAPVSDFLDLKPREFFTYGDVFRAPDGTEGVMMGVGTMGSRRVVLKPQVDGVEIDYRRGQWYDRDELVGVRHRGTDSGYDRIIMNPPFSDGRDIQHVQHAYTLLRPGGRLVALMGESAFTNQNKRATEFREWLESVGGTEEKLAEGTFNDPSLPVNTSANARMVVIEKPSDSRFSRKWQGPFYSALSKELESVNAGAQPALGWASTINGLVKAGKVKQDEVEWSGVLDFLRLQTGKVSKASVVQFLEANGVKVEEVTLGDAQGTFSFVATDGQRRTFTSMEEAQKDFDAERAWVEENAATIDRGEDEIVVQDGNSQDLQTFTRQEDGTWEDQQDRVFDDEDSAMEAAQEVVTLEQDGLLEAMSREIEGDEAPNQAKYSQYTLPGGTNYREVLLTLPAKSSADQARAEYEAWASRNGLQPNATFTEERYKRETGKEAPAPRTMTAMNADAAQNFRSSHWDQPNVLAHIRVNDRTDADGKRVLFVEELQSDWAQGLRKNGTQTTTNRFSVRDVNGNIRGDFATAEEADAYLQNPPENMRQFFEWRMGGEAARIVETSAPDIGIPNGPFVGKTDAWLSLALKRIVKMAVDEGYDRVAFVNGEQSAERYDLSKQIGAINYEPIPDTDLFEIEATDLNGKTVLAEDEVTLARIEELVGKEIAKKIEAREGKVKGEGGYRDWHRLSGLDLKVGGEGMKKFYDAIVPNTLKEVLRKVGGGALETVDFGVDESVRILRAQLQSTPYDPQYASERDELRKKIAQAEAGAGMKQPGFTITPAMKERAANGLPLFDRKTPASTGMPAQKVRLMAAPIAKRLHIDLRVVDTPAGLPIPAPSDAVGLYHNGTIWIVASNVKTRQDIMQAVAHEAVAHLGLRQLLEPTEYRHLMAMINAGAASNGKLAEAKAWVRRAYVDRSGKFNLTPIQEADEIAARVAELGVDADGNFRPGFEWLKAMFAKVMEWLRSKGLDVPFTNAELQGMLVRAQTLLERGPEAAGQMGTAFSLSGSRTDVRRMNEKQIALEIRVLMPRVEIAYAKGNMALAERLDARLETLMEAMESNLLEMQEDTLDMAYDGFNRAVLEKEGQQGDIEADLVIDLANRWLQITKPGSFESKEFSTDAERAATLRALLSDYEHRHGGLKEGLSDETIIEAAKDAVASVYGLREARHARAQARQGLTPYRPDDMTPEQIQAQMAAMADAGDAAAAATRAEQEAARATADGETPIPDWMRATQFMRRPDIAGAAKTAGNTAAHYRSLGLQALGRRQITELYGDILPQLPAYNTLMAQMDADKNEAGAEADQIAQDWGKLKDERQLAELMHDATLAQMDPEKPLMRGDDPLTYDRLREKFVALSPEARKVYVDARETYRTHHENVRKAIRDRIERSELRGQRKAELLQQMDQEFYQAIKGVYFPLARFGDYVVIVRDITGKAVSVNRAETINEAEALQAELRRAYPEMTVGKVLKSKEFNAGRDAVGRGFMQNLYEALGKADMDEKQRADLEDMLGQLYLSALPDLSWAKHGIHRKGTPGFSQDARRAFAQNTFHGARYLSKVRYSDLLENELIDAQKQVDSMSESESFESIKAQQVIDEMVKRHDAAMNPESNALSTALTSLGFVFHLGLSPASAMVNLTQTALVAYPIMGAKWGFDKAAAALLKASQQAAANRNDISAALSPEEKMAYDEAVRSGVIDVTMAHDLAGISQGEDAKVSWKLRPVMRWASFLFHHAEKFNRQATFVAAYRLAREAGSNPVQAYEQATKATYDGHFDYSATNRPRLMQGNAARVILLFKQYGQNMVYTLSRQAYLSMKGKNQFERAQARKALGGLLAMHAAAAGALGLPMVSTLLAAASMLGSDDDEPWDAEVALRNMLADALGDQAADVLARGLSRLTPWDISGRVALDKLILPDIQEGLEGQRLGESAMAAALGPVAGIGISLLRGMQEISEGNFAKGLETMAPAFARGPLRAIRYQAEGAIDKTGKPIVEDVSAAGVLGQALGFSPSEVRLATEAKSAVHQADAKLTQRRSILMRQYSLAVIAGDEEGAADAREDILAFNEKNPGRRINPLQMARSVATRRKQIAESQGGVYLPKNRRDAMEAGQFGM